MSRKSFVPVERGAVLKRGPVRLSVALVYPNSYTVGMANLGFQTVYRLFNEVEGVRCERVFLPQTSARVRSYESKSRLEDFDIVAFSVSFELDYVNVAEILISAGLPLRSVEREESAPLIIAGGVSVTLNPEPLAPLVDLFVIGEAEEILRQLIDRFLIPRRGRPSRSERLQDLAHIPGVYIPRFYSVEYDTRGFLASVESTCDVPQRVKRQYVQDISSIQTYSPVISSESHFREMFLVEVGRGCPRGCRFCASGYIYQPFRCRSGGDLISLIRDRGAETKRIGLVGSAVSDHRQFEDLCIDLVREGYQLGVSSFRADALTPRLVEAFVRGGLRTLTLAPETGSERLRDRIHKNLKDEEILAAVRVASAGGISNLKLYFMIGFPFGDEYEISDIIALIKRIRGQFFDRKSLRGKITVSVHPFVPKASTPFQWCAMENMEKLGQQLARIERALRGVPGVRVSGKSPRRAFLQGLFSVGDRRIGEALCHKMNDRLHWKRAWQKAEIVPEFFVYREKLLDEVLPWDVLDSGIGKEVLWEEYQKAKVSV